jgi:hypothetical protein
VKYKEEFFVPPSGEIHPANTLFPFFVNAGWKLFHLTLFLLWLQEQGSEGSGSSGMDLPELRRAS